MDERSCLGKLKEIGDELARRAETPLAKYNRGEKVHRKQLEFHRCPKRNRWVFGGNRSGKTECGAVETVYLARGIHPYRENRKDVFGWVVSLSREVQRDVAQKKILHYLPPEWISDVVMSSGRKDSPENGVIDQIMVKNVFGGISVIGFKSCDQGREKFQGSSLDFVWFDEEPPEDVYRECLMRVIDRKGDVFGTMTPLKGLTYIHDEIYLNEGNSPEVWYEFFEWADNPFLSEEEAKEMTAGMSESELESRRYGRFRSNSGLVYPEFEENVHVVDPFPVPADWQNRLSIDPGLNNPLSCHWYAVDYDGNVFVVAEHYAAGKDVGWHADRIREISDRIGWRRDGDGKIRALIDSAANQRTLASAKSVTELFHEHGIAADPRVDKDLFAGIARVKEYFKEKKLFLFRGCDNLVRELKSYRWGEGDVPRKRDDHCLDELRYFLMSRPKTRPPKEKKSEVAKEKERLARRLSRRRNRM
ncbi:MAG: terminase family protein [Candidatus Borkfalkiaceae bacterium]|nr:terminase family protein [Christensenellaceae bacterium]